MKQVTHLSDKMASLFSSFLNFEPSNVLPSETLVSRPGINEILYSNEMYGLPVYGLGMGSLLGCAVRNYTVKSHTMHV